jgi:Holliday junction resolvase RusA-like endonuclease
MPTPERRVIFRVDGKPEPAGSKRAFAVKRKTGGGWVATGQIAITDANPKSKGWQAEVRDVATAAMMRTFGPEPELLTGPLGLVVVFTLRRPKSHFGTGRNAATLKPSAPCWATTKPDATKLVRGLEDALTGVVWGDDAQVVEQTVTKRYGARTGADVHVWEVADDGDG